MVALTSYSNFENIQLNDAIQSVKSGDESVVIADFFSQEEAGFLRSLSLDIIWKALDNLHPNNCMNLTDRNIGVIDSETVKNSEPILSRFTSTLQDLYGFNHLLIVRGNRSIKWHTDGGRVSETISSHALRVTLAFDQNICGTTQFFMPTEDEFNQMKDLKDGLDSKVSAITNSEPERIKKGNFGQVCVFHTATIHRGPVDGCADRILITLFGPATDPIPFPRTKA